MNPSLGAHGKPATFTGSNGLMGTKEAGPFSNAGSREGGPSPMPEAARSGAMECDESCRGYTGNPRDGGGPLGMNAGGGNRIPSAGMGREMAR